MERTRTSGEAAAVSCAQQNPKTGRSTAGVALRLLALVVAMVGWTAGAVAQVLSIHTGSVTTYIPSSASSGQDIRPQVNQRGVHLDGSLRAGAMQMVGVGANPFEPGSGVNRRLGDLDLATGSYAPTSVDLSLPAPGAARWTIGRSYNHRQRTSGAALRDSDGPQGVNWFQMSQPEIVVHDPAGDSDDAVYLIYGADRFAEFVKTGAGSTVYAGRNGAGGIFQYSSGSPDTWIYNDPSGVKLYFFGGNTSSNRADYQIWKIVDEAGNTAYVGDASTASTAASSGYNTDKTINVAYDGISGDGRRYTYSYSTIGGRTRLTQVAVETKSSGSWSSPSGVVEVARVIYDYIAADGDDYGKAGDLTQPDAIWFTQYFDETGQTLSRVTTDADPAGSPTDMWATEVLRDSSGRVTDVRTPAANTGYTHSTGALTASSSVGLIHAYTRVSGGNQDGFVESVKWKEGTSGTAYFISYQAYSNLTKSVGSATLVRPYISTTRSYKTQTSSTGSSGTDYDQTSASWSAHSSTVAPKTVTYDANGNLTDDGLNYDYVYDAFNRLRFVKTQAGATKAEYRYNGLNQRIAWHYDVDADNDVDSSDNWFYFTHDEKWRIVATHRGNGGGTTVETDPKERFIYHMAGLGGDGSSNYIDSVILRDRDNTSGWNSSSDGALEERRYYIQNWRADVVALLSDTGAMVERIKYSAYGIPFNLPMGDNDCNGICNSTDVGQINTWILAGTWSALGDTDLDGDVDSTDATNAGNNLITTGRTLLSYSGVGNRIGWAGYQAAPELSGNMWHVRNRFFSSGTGRWHTRDPLGYVATLTLYEYVLSRCIREQDPTGLACEAEQKILEAANIALAAAVGGLLACGVTVATGPGLLVCLSVASLWYWSCVKSYYGACLALNNCERANGLPVTDCRLPWRYSQPGQPGVSPVPPGMDPFEFYHHPGTSSPMLGIYPAAPGGHD